MKKKYRYIPITCPRCDGSREEPGAPIEDDGGFWVCQRCDGAGTVRRRVSIRKKGN